MRMHDDENREYRPMTLDEAKRLEYGRRAAIRLRDGRVGRVKVNGRPKTWKREATRVEVPVKYGLYEYATCRVIETTEGTVIGTDTVCILLTATDGQGEWR